MAGRLVQSVFLIYFPLRLQVFQKPKLLAGDHQVFRVKLIGFLHTHSQKSPKCLKVVFISGYIHFGQNQGLHIILNHEEQQIAEHLALVGHLKLTIHNNHLVQNFIVIFFGQTQIFLIEQLLVLVLQIHGNQLGFQILSQLHFKIHQSFRHRFRKKKMHRLCIH